MIGLFNISIVDDIVSLRVAGSSSTISLNPIVDDGIVNDIVDEIVTCGRVLIRAP